MINRTNSSCWKQIFNAACYVFLFQFVGSFVINLEPSVSQQLKFSVYDVDSRYVPLSIFYAKHVCVC